MDKYTLKILYEFLNINCKNYYLFKEEIDVFEDNDKFYFYKNIYIQESKNYIFPLEITDIGKMTEEEKAKLEKIKLSKKLNNF
jgi:hypothetical protein